MIELKKITKTFGKKEALVEALKDVSLSVKDGEMAAIMGKSGSGKSTLLNIIGGMLSFNSGEYLYNNKPINFKSQKKLTEFRRKEIGFVVQYFALVDDLNIYRNVALPLKYMGVSAKNIKKRVMSALDELGIADKAKAYPYELSGGQQQRAAIARAIVKQPSVILADEPTGALDEATGNEVLSIFKQLNDNGRTVLIVTHDEKIAEGCGRIIRLKDGMVCDDSETQQNKGKIGVVS